MLGIYSQQKKGWFGELLYTSPTLKVKKLETFLDLSKPLQMLPLSFQGTKCAFNDLPK